MKTPLPLGPRSARARHFCASTHHIVLHKQETVGLRVWGGSPNRQVLRPPLLLLVPRRRARSLELVPEVVVPLALRRGVSEAVLPAPLR